MQAADRSGGVRISASADGARCARTPAPVATRGIAFGTTRRGLLSLGGGGDRGISDERIVCAARSRFEIFTLSGSGAQST